MSNGKRTYCNSVRSATTALPHRRAFFKAAMAAKEQQDEEPIGIKHVLEHIEPILANIDKNLPQTEKVHLAVEANVRLSMKNILAYPGHLEAHQRGEFELVGAVYDLHTGTVRFLDRA